MTFREEFSDYDNAAAFERILAALAPHGFEDSSWKNDACPSLTFSDADGEPVIRLWINYRDAALREDEGHEEFWLDYGGFGNPCESVEHAIELAGLAIIVENAE